MWLRMTLNFLRTSAFSSWMLFELCCWGWNSGGFVKARKAPRSAEAIALHWLLMFPSSHTFVFPFKHIYMDLIAICMHLLFCHFWIYFWTNFIFLVIGQKYFFEWIIDIIMLMSIWSLGELGFFWSFGFYFGK